MRTPPSTSDPISPSVSLAWLRDCFNSSTLKTERTVDAAWIPWCVQEGLAPLLTQHLIDPPQEFSRECRQLAMRELAHQEALSRLALACAQRSIEVMVIKGEALARTLYEMPCTRTRIDIDLWVDTEQLKSLRSVLEQIGFPAITSIQQTWARFEVVHGRTTPPSVAFDIHVHPFFRPRMLPRRPFSSVWRDAAELPGLAPLRAPAAYDAFLISALHLAKNPHKRAIWVYDIDRFCAQHPTAVIDVCAVAPSWQLAQLIADALQNATAVFGTELPCEIPRARSAEPLASMLALPNKFTALRRDLLVLPDWRARAKFVLELLFRPNNPGR